MRERLYLNRFGSGFSQSALAQLRAAGSPEAWLAAQMTPSSVTEDPKVQQIDTWFSALTQTPAQKYATNAAGTKNKGSFGLDLGNWSLMRRIYAKRSLLETMTEFWSNTLHIAVNHDFAWVYRFDYDKTIRQNALGTFEDLLRDCSLHPAMRTYLDNWKSVKGAPNENQGRELLELHTVGIDAGYTENMVKDSAKILSGYTVDYGTGKSFAAVYDSSKHTTGAVSVLGFSSANSSADGQAVTVAYLSYLAHHPATARRIATKLATFFVSDKPSANLIDQLTNVYLSSGTDIKAVLTALSQHPEFLTSEGQKVRTPYADLVSTARALGIGVATPKSASSWANMAQTIHYAMNLYSWPRPDGAPLDNASWSSVSRVFGSCFMHYQLATAWWPRAEAVYRTPASWLPVASLRFDAYVDHLYRLWFGKAAESRHVEAAAQAVSKPGAVISAATIITSKHALAGSLWARLAIALLDSPDGMTT